MSELFFLKSGMTRRSQPSMLVLSIVLEVLTSVERTEKITIKRKKQKRGHFPQMMIIYIDIQKNIQITKIKV